MKNVVLLTIDACRKDVFGCYGGKGGLTPFLDSLVEKCLMFTKAQSIGPYTQASFPGILTSSYYLDFGWQQKCPPERIFVSEILKRAGIVTAGFHSNPYLCGYFGWNRGWDLFFDSMKEKVTPQVPFLKGDKINRRVETWLSSYKAKADTRPFFLWVHYMDIHEPYIPPPEYLNFVDTFIELNENDMFSLFNDVILKRDTSDLQKVKLLKALYDAHVREVDAYAEAFFGILESLRLLRDTVVIITSDHGDEFNEHGSLSHDSTMYSELIDVPLLIYDFDRPRGEKCEHPVSNIDLPPTVTHLFGVAPPAQWKGSSLLPISEYTSRGCFGEAIGKKGKGEIEVKKKVHYYREGDLKIIYREEGEVWELYDLEKDPGEKENIVEQSSRADEMKNRVRSRFGRA